MANSTWTWEVLDQNLAVVRTKTKKVVATLEAGATRDASQNETKLEENAKLIAMAPEMIGIIAHLYLSPALKWAIEDYELRIGEKSSLRNIYKTIHAILTDLEPQAVKGKLKQFHFPAPKR